MIDLRDGEVVTIRPCRKCGCREHSLSFADSHLAKLWSECAECGHKSPISLDGVYESLRPRRTADELKEWLSAND